MKIEKILFGMSIGIIMFGGIKAGATVLDSILVRTVEIKADQTQVATPIVGTSLEATTKSKNDIESIDDLAVFLKAGWVGYPMTHEYIVNLSPGATDIHTEKQSKPSNFQTILEPYKGIGGCIGRSTMEVYI